MNKREALRNKRAEDVCREVRHFFATAHGDYACDDLKQLLELTLKWMNVAKKNKYDRPEVKIKPINQ